MKLQKMTQHRHRRHGEDNLIPLINIVFLLLIFFMVMGKLAPADAFKVHPPQSESEALSDPKQITLLVSVENQLAIDGVITSPNDLTARIAERLKIDQTISIALKADAGLPAKYLLSVLNDLRGAGVEKLTLLTALSQ